MNNTKKAFYFCAIIIILLIICGFFLPNKIILEHTAIINADKGVVFKNINDLTNWEKWLPLDLSSIKYFDIHEGIGSGFIMENNSMGTAKIELLESIEDSLIKSKLDLLIGESAFVDWHIQNHSDSIKLNCLFSVKLGMNPIMRYLGLFIKQKINDHLIC